jgi:hypothetical protein
LVSISVHARSHIAHLSGRQLCGTAHTVATQWCCTSMVPLLQASFLFPRT